MRVYGKEIGKIDIPDANLKTALNEILATQLNQTRQPTDPIYPSEAIQVESVNVYARGIKDITGLGTFTSVTYLAISNNAITDLSPINNIIDLGQLQFRYFNAQTVDLDPFPIERKYTNPIRDQDNQPMIPRTAFGTNSPQDVTFDTDGNWTWHTEGDHSLIWETQYGDNYSFQGTINQTAGPLVPPTQVSVDITHTCDPSQTQPGYYDSATFHIRNSGSIAIPATTTFLATTTPNEGTFTNQHIYTGDTNYFGSQSVYSGGHLGLTQDLQPNDTATIVVTRNADYTLSDSGANATLSGADLPDYFEWTNFHDNTIALDWRRDVSPQYSWCA